MDSHGLRRFACDELSETIRELLADYTNPDHLRITLLRLVEKGKLAAVADIALGIALGDATTTHIRITAIRSVVAAVPGALGVLWLLLAFVLVRNIGDSVQWTVESARNFFGVLRVEELYKSDPALHQFSLTHGRIEHGFQFVDPQKHLRPVSYYGPDAGVGLALLHHPNRLRGQPMRIGVIGLGAGTTAVYGRPGDFIRFYEINPDVVRLSDKYFSYRRAGAAGSDVVLGDARISLERARDRETSERFDVLVVDAFSSDAIPVHLLTREMFETYRYHLKPDGILAFHITSRYFNLSPVVRNLVAPGAGTQMQALLFHHPGNPMQWTDRTDWVLLTSNRAFIGSPEVQSRITPWQGPVPPNSAWTDDYSNLFRLIQERINEQD
jgi:hypothetical protein